MPTISVVIPVHNGARTLPRTLSSLREQVGAPSFEVIVVDDGSTDGSSDVAADFGVRLIRHHTPRGAGAARNSGAAHASATMLAFTDSDCDPAPDWVARMVAALSRCDLVQGKVVPDPVAGASPFDRTLTVPEFSSLYETANLGVRSELFERVGGFMDPGEWAPLGTPAGVPPFGEDTWFGWRAHRTGASVRFADDAVVRHEVVKRSAREFILEHWRLRYLPSLVKLIPELRDSFNVRVLQSRRRGLLLAGFAAAFSPRGRRLLGPPICLAYLRAVGLRAESPSWTAKYLLVTFLADLTAVAALAYGTLRARTPVL